MNDKYTISLPVIDRYLASDDIYYVLPETDLDVREGLETLAKYFQRESHYDNIQYEANNHDSKCCGFVFTESAFDMLKGGERVTPTRLVGGGCFRHREYKDGTRWCFFWIWIHPYFRNKGLLSKHWEEFEEKFKYPNQHRFEERLQGMEHKDNFLKFELEPPLSNGMVSFLRKHVNSKTKCFKDLLDAI